jgi:uncharacterized protein (PEP-CTERM system associated)
LALGVALLAAPTAWAQQAPGAGGLQQAPGAGGLENPGGGTQGGTPPLVSGNPAGGFGATQLFSAFPADAALSPPSLLYPGYTPSTDAPRPLAVTLGISGSESWTDNVFGVAPDRAAPGVSTDRKTSDFITSVDPSVGVSVDSRRFQGGLSYDVAYDRYASNTRMDGFRQNGIGLFDSEVIDKTFFIDARGSVSEQNTSPVGTVTGSPRTSATNLTRVYTGSVTPSLQQMFGDWAVGQVAFHHDETRNQNASQITGAQVSPLGTTTTPNDNHTDGGRVELRSGTYFSRFLWDYTGETSRNVSSNNRFDTTTHTVGSEYRVTSDFGLLASGGYDHDYSRTADLSKYTGGFYVAGFHWTPSPDTDFRFGGGRRDDHADWSALVEHHFSPMTVVRVSVDSGITNDAMAFEQALSAVQQGASGGFIDPFTGLSANPSFSPFGLSSSVYWQRTTNFVVSHQELRDSFSLTGSIAERQLLANGTTTSGVVTTLPIGSHSTAVTTSLAWSHQVSEVTSSVATVGESDTRQTDNVLTGSKRFQGSLALNHSLNSTLAASLGYFYSASLSGTSGGIRENVVSLSLKKTF